LVCTLVAALAVFVVAAVLVGREATRLGHQPLAAVVDVEEAVHYVADRLPEEQAVVLTYDDVRQLVQWYVAHLRRTGVSPPPGREPVAPEREVVVDDVALAAVLERADDAGMEVQDADVLAVVDLVVDYLASAGAVGPPALPAVSESPESESPALPPAAGNGRSEEPGRE
jgi:hypothetical protein